MYKAVFIDLDGTLVNSNGIISEENKKAIETASNMGIEIVICSGRQRVSARKFKDMLKSSKYLISANGAEIYDCENEEILFESPIDTETCKELCNIAFQNNMVVKLNFGLGRTTNKPYDVEFYELELPENETNNFLDKNKITQILFGSEDLDILQKIKSIVAEKPNIKIVNKFMWHVNDKIFHSVHVTSPNISKGNSMIGLCKFLKINPKDVIAIGDKWNDIPMLELAGFGVAMGNASDEVKSQADFITDTNNENGVAKILNKIINNDI